MSDPHSPHNPHNLRTTWETYVRAWRAETPEEQRALYAESLKPECVYTDPLITATGWDQLQAYMDRFHQQIPGGHFVTTRFLAHHGRSVATWTMVAGDGQIVGDGISYGHYDATGKLVAMTGFFETPG